MGIWLYSPFTQVYVCSPQTGTSSFAFHNAHPTAMATLTAPANHSAADIPTLLLLNHPPIIPPRSSVTADATRRFLFTLFRANICGSLIRSQNKLVNTVVGTSLIPRVRLVTICPPLWNARKPIGSNSMNPTFPGSSSEYPVGDGTTCRCTSAAATKIRIACTRKEAASVKRRWGCMRRDCAKK